MVELPDRWWTADGMLDRAVADTDPAVVPIDGQQALPLPPPTPERPAGAS